MKYIDTPSSKIFFTSDLHFGHAGIIDFASRPFANANIMDETLIANWNRVVPEDGLVFVLGDVGFAPAHQLKQIFRQLNGSKILIRGNHDSNYSEKLLSSLFAEIHDLLYVRVQSEKNKRYTYMVLCHYPMLDWQSSFRGAWQLFGHVHTRDIPEFGTFNTHLFAHQYDVGVDNNNFTPVSFEKLHAIIQSQEKYPLFKETNYY